MNSSVSELDLRPPFQLMIIKKLEHTGNTIDKQIVATCNFHTTTNFTDSKWDLAHEFFNS